MCVHNREQRADGRSVMAAMARTSTYVRCGVRQQPPKKPNAFFLSVIFIPEHWANVHNFFLCLFFNSDTRMPWHGNYRDIKISSCRWCAWLCLAFLWFMHILFLSQQPHFSVVLMCFLYMLVALISIHSFIAYEYFSGYYNWSGYFCSVFFFFLVHNFIICVLCFGRLFSVRTARTCFAFHYERFYYFLILRSISIATLCVCFPLSV